MRLTNELRESIINKALGATVGSKVKLERAKIPAVADKLYEKAIGGNMDLVQGLPRGYLVEDSTIGVECKNAKVYFDCIRRRRYGELHLDLSKSRRMPYFLQTGKIKFTELSGPGKELLGINTRLQELKKDEEIMRKHLHSVLYAANTLKQLQEIWPEGKKYFPEPQKKQALIPKTDELNALLSTHSIAPQQ